MDQHDDDHRTFKYHANRVRFVSKANSAPIVGGGLTVKDYYITSGQDPDGKNYVGLKRSIDGNGDLVFDVGRQLTDKTAEWFKSQISAKETTFQHDPGGLNFAFLVEITFQIGGTDQPGWYTFEDIMLAQGQAAESNNWWIGGKGAEFQGGYTIKCPGKVNQGGAYSKASFEFNRGGAPGSHQEVWEIWIMEIEVSSG